MKKIIYIVLVIGFVLSACAPSEPATEAPSTPLPVDPASSTMPAITDPSQPIIVKTGDVFMIAVEANPSTGYHWEVVGELSGIEVISHEFTTSEPVIPGSGGVDVWTLKATSAGETSFVLGNFPPGEGTVPEQELQFTIGIE